MEDLARASGKADPATESLDDALISHAINNFGLENIIKVALDLNDPKAVHIAIKKGFQKKIDEMNEKHVAYIQEIRARNDLQMNDKWRLIEASDGKIRSMKWFKDTIAGV